MYVRKAIRSRSFKKFKVSETSFTRRQKLLVSYLTTFKLYKDEMNKRLGTKKKKSVLTINSQLQPSLSKNPDLKPDPDPDQDIDKNNAAVPRHDLLCMDIQDEKVYLKVEGA